jgi:hypothetical protein
MTAPLAHADFEHLDTQQAHTAGHILGDSLRHPEDHLGLLVETGKPGHPAARRVHAEDAAAIEHHR